MLAALFWRSPIYQHSWLSTDCLQEREAAISGLRRCCSFHCRTNCSASRILGRSQMPFCFLYIFVWATQAKPEIGLHVVLGNPAPLHVKKAEVVSSMSCPA